MIPPTRTITLAATVLALLLPAAVAAAELLVGTVNTESNPQARFVLDAENREELIGGAIQLGADTYQITKQSRYGLIGALRTTAVAADASGAVAEVLVFSSSFSEQTSTGQPWVAALEHRNCDTAYNSFLARYRIAGRERIEALGAVPYPKLVEDIALSDNSTVYCFMSSRGADNTGSK